MMLVAGSRDGVGQADRSDALRTLAAGHGWGVTSESSSVWIGVIGPRPLRLRRLGSWVVAGDLFRRDGGSPASLDLSSDGASTLVDQAWGRYIAVQLDPSGQPAAVMRDPSGSFECLVWEDDGLTVVATDLPSWLTDHLQPPWSIDYDRVGAALVDPLTMLSGSLLKGITALLPGTIQNLPVRGAARTLWNPADVARTGPGTPMADPGRVLREAIMSSTVALAGSCGPAVAEISGGLDSSIVASCLVRGPEADVRAWVNVFGPDPEADERDHADELCALLGIRPTCMPRATGAITREGLRAISWGFRPGQNGMDVMHDRQMAERCRDWEVQAVITGKGGDAVLVQGLTGDVLLDDWKAHGWRAGTLASTLGVARWTGRSVWSLLMDGLRSAGDRQKDAHATTAAIRLYAGGTAQAGAPHPWLADVDDLGPGKRAQIAGLIDGLGFSGTCRQTEICDLIHPLLSQPVTEVCLSLPTPVLTRCRRDRALAREAFAGHIPASILDRRGKGELTAYFGRMIAGSLDVLRPLLLEGQLARRGLLDRSLTEAALTRESLIWRGGYAEILRAAVIEAWADAWEHRLRR